MSMSTGIKPDPWIKLEKGTDNEIIVRRVWKEPGATPYVLYESTEGVLAIMVDRRPKHKLDWDRQVRRVTELDAYYKGKLSEYLHTPTELTIRIKQQIAADLL